MTKEILAEIVHAEMMNEMAADDANIHNAARRIAARLNCTMSDARGLTRMALTCLAEGMKG